MGINQQTDTQFVDFQTPVPATWLNNVNDNVQGIYPITYYGAKCDGITDDTAAIQAAINAASAQSLSAEGPMGRVIAPVGRTIKTSAPLTMSVPIQFHIPSYIYYAGNTGSAVIVGATPPVNGRNTGYDIWIDGIRAIGNNWSVQPTMVDGSQVIGSITGTVLTVSNLLFGHVSVGHVVSAQGIPVGTTIVSNGTGTGGVGTYNLSAPATIAGGTRMNTTSTVGIEFRAMQFSTVRINEIIGFRSYGFWGNSTNDQFNLQHTQDNDIWLGQIAFNGAGIYLNSVSGADGAFQVANLNVQNSFANFVNCQVDTGFGGLADNASSSNYLRFSAMDAPAPGGQGLMWNSQYSYIEMGYCAGPVVFGATSANTDLYAYNNFETAASFFDGGNGTNWMTTGSPDISVLPAHLDIVPGTALQNSFGVPVMIYTTAHITPNAGGATNVVVTVGPQTAMRTIITPALAAGTGPTVSLPISFMAPPMQFWQITTNGPGSVTFDPIQFLRAG